MKIRITFNCKTDGDIDFMNEDDYFIKSFEYYGKTSLVEIENLKKELENLLKEINSRVFNYYGQKEGLVKFIKNLNMDLFKEIDLENIDFENIDFEEIQILNGNQDISITLLKVKDEQEDSEEIFKLLENVKVKYNKIEAEIEEIRQNYRKEGQDRFEEWNEKMLSLVKVQNFIEDFIGKKFQR
jgi:hypothetical protein